MEPKTESSKPACQFFAHEDDIGEDVVESKVKVCEEHISAVESKIDAIESKVDAVEGKVWMQLKRKWRT